MAKSDHITMPHLQTSRAKPIKVCYPQMVSRLVWFSTPINITEVAVGLVLRFGEDKDLQQFTAIQYTYIVWNRFSPSNHGRIGLIAGHWSMTDIFKLDILVCDEPWETKNIAEMHCEINYFHLSVPECYTMITWYHCYCLSILLLLYYCFSIVVCIVIHCPPLSVSILLKIIYVYIRPTVLVDWLKCKACSYGMDKLCVWNIMSCMRSV